MNWRALLMAASATLVMLMVLGSLAGAVVLARAGRWRRGVVLGTAALGYLFGLGVAVGGSLWGVAIAWVCGITVGAIAVLRWLERRRARTVRAG